MKPRRTRAVPRLSLLGEQRALILTEEFISTFISTHEQRLLFKRDVCSASVIRRPVRQTCYVSAGRVTRALTAVSVTMLRCSCPSLRLPRLRCPRPLHRWSLPLFWGSLIQQSMLYCCYRQWRCPQVCVVLYDRIEQVLDCGSWLTHECFIT